MERKIRREYQQAAKELEEKLDDYFKRFEKKDEIWRRRLAKGEVTAAEYKQWRTGQIMVGQRWQEMKETISQDLNNANMLARSTVNGYMPEVYALNHNYATFLAEKGAGVDTSYTLYNRQAVERIMRDNPDILPAPGKRMKKILKDNPDIAWQEGQIQSVTMQAIIQGESIPNMSKRIANTLGEINHKDTIRYARTAATGAQNAGRVDGFLRAQAMGIDLEQEWVATLDNRTRHEHRILDGQTAKVGEPFKVDGEEILFPGDPHAAGHLIWNCRCTLRARVKGWESKSSLARSDKAIKGMSYSEWEKGHSKSRPIDYQEKVGKSIKYSYINEFYKGK